MFMWKREMTCLEILPEGFHGGFIGARQLLDVAVLGIGISSHQLRSSQTGLTASKLQDFELVKMFRLVTIVRT